MAAVVPIGASSRNIQNLSLELNLLFDEIRLLRILFNFYQNLHLEEVEKVASLSQSAVEILLEDTRGLLKFFFTTKLSPEPAIRNLAAFLFNMPHQEVPLKTVNFLSRGCVGVHYSPYYQAAIASNSESFYRCVEMCRSQELVSMRQLKDITVRFAQEHSKNNFFFHAIFSSSKPNESENYARNYVRFHVVCKHNEQKNLHFYMQCGAEQCIVYRDPFSLSPWKKCYHSIHLHTEQTAATASLL